MAKKCDFSGCSHRKRKSSMVFFLRHRDSRRILGERWTDKCIWNERNKTNFDTFDLQLCENSNLMSHQFVTFGVFTSHYMSIYICILNNAQALNSYASDFETNWENCFDFSPSFVSIVIIIIIHWWRADFPLSSIRLNSLILLSLDVRRSFCNNIFFFAIHLFSIVDAEAFLRVTWICMMRRVFFFTQHEKDVASSTSSTSSIFIEFSNVDRMNVLLVRWTPICIPFRLFFFFTFFAFFVALDSNDAINHKRSFIFITKRTDETNTTRRVTAQWKPKIVDFVNSFYNFECPIPLVAVAHSSVICFAWTVVEQ